MWESIGRVLSKLAESPALWIFSVGMIYACMKRGMIRINTGAVQIGRTRDNERNIIAEQISWATLHCDAIAQKMCNDLPHINKFHIKYCVERIQNEIVRRIACNHLSLDEVYQNNLYLTLLDITRKRANDKFYYSEEFESFVRQEVTDILTALINIRKSKTSD